MSYYQQSTGPTAPPAAQFGNPDNFSVQSVNLEEFSYQSAYGTNAEPGLAAKTSEEYGLSSAFLVDQKDSGMTRPPKDISDSGRVLDGSHLPNMRGDANLRPNTGNINQTAGDPLGSLQEITSRLRWMTIVSTCAAIVWEGFDFPLRLFGESLTNPAQVVLGAYLGVLCLLVLGAEFNHPALKENFGVLYFPLSRGLFLLLMSSMCLGILNKWWESLLGLNFAIVGIGYVYAYIKYPEYRRWQHFNERMPTAWQEAKMYWSDESAIRTAAWATPQAAIGAPTETQPLLV